MTNPIINIITRTHRPEMFKICLESIKIQSYPNYALHVGSDVLPCDYPYVVPLKLDTTPITIPPGHYFAPWNQHLETLAKFCVPGFVMYLDDDDKFTSPKSLQRIVNAIDNEDQLLVWKVQITKDWSVPSHSFGHFIQAGDFSGIGMCFHTKYLPVEWGRLSYGDYRVAQQLLNKKLTVKWIDMVLTSTQNGPRNGRK